MPRRISDYPDAFAGWNFISSFGSTISVIATWLFLRILYAQLVEGKETYRYPWITPQFYTDLLKSLLNRAYNSLEWCLNSPPKPHAFVSLPLQSLGFNLVKFKETMKDSLSFKNTIILFLSLTIAFYLRQKLAAHFQLDLKFYWDFLIVGGFGATI